MPKIEEPKELVKVNNSIKAYGGLYANWKSGGCKKPLPEELTNRLIDLQTTVDIYLTHFKDGTND